MWALGAFHVSPLAATYSDLLRQAATRLDLQLAVIQFYFCSSQARLKCAAAFEAHLYWHTHTQWHTHSTHSQTYSTCYTCYPHMQHTLYPSKKSFLPNFVIFLIKTHSAWLSFNTNKTHTVTTAHTLIHTHTPTLTVITTQLHSLAIWLMHRNAAAVPTWAQKTQQKTKSEAKSYKSLPTWRMLNL